MQIEELKERAYKKKEGLPVYATRFTHRISIRIVGLLKDTSIHPNSITTFSIALGLASAGLFCFSNRYTLLLGALFLEAYYIFDAVDGQLARVVGKSSVTGAYYDYISNHIVHSVVFFSIGFGLYRYYGAALYLLAGACAGWGMLFMHAIYDARYNILFSRRGRAHEPTRPFEFAGGRAKASSLKKVFILLHQLCRYPTIMNLITVFSILNFILISSGVLEAPVLMKALILFYAAAVNVVWVSKLFRMIITGDLDKSHDTA